MQTACSAEPCVAAAAVVFPTELIAFTGQLSTDHVALSWQTATETENSHFFVERSTNGFTFTAIGRVEGAGTTNDARSYTYPDYTYHDGRNYYRLRQVDFDGSESLSEVVTIDAGEPVHSLQAFPNPVAAGTEVTVGLDRAWSADLVSVALFTADGRKVNSLSFSGTDRLVIPTQGLSTGLHLIRISNGRQTATQRLMVR